jgi:serine/threonine protein kinase HipA of HipAB toxin-antitoxin module
LNLIERATRPGADRLNFIGMLIFHYLVGNADTHAKNFSLLYRGKVPNLAPIYDVRLYDRLPAAGQTSRIRSSCSTGRHSSLRRAVRSVC